MNPQLPLLGDGDTLATAPGSQRTDLLGSHSQTGLDMPIDNLTLIAPLHSVLSRTNVCDRILSPVLVILIKSLFSFL